MKRCHFRATSCFGRWAVAPEVPAVAGQGFTGYVK